MKKKRSHQFSKGIGITCTIKPLEFSDTTIFTGYHHGVSSYLLHAIIKKAVQCNIPFCHLVKKHFLTKQLILSIT